MATNVRGEAERRGGRFRLLDIRPECFGRERYFYKWIVFRDLSDAYALNAT